MNCGLVIIRAKRRHGAAPDGMIAAIPAARAGARVERYEREGVFVPYVTIGFGVLLTLIGVGGYVMSGMVSWTALIPAFLGVPMALLGGLATKESLLKHAMHGAAMVGLLGLLGTASGLFKFFRMLGGAEVARPEAVKVQALVAVLCAVFIGLCVNSFIQARKARTAAS